MKQYKKYHAQIIEGVDLEEFCPIFFSDYFCLFTLAKYPGITVFLNVHYSKYYTFILVDLSISLQGLSSLLFYK